MNWLIRPFKSVNKKYSSMHDRWRAGHSVLDDVTMSMTWMLGPFGLKMMYIKIEFDWNLNIRLKSKISFFWFLCIFEVSIVELSHKNLPFFFFDGWKFIQKSKPYNRLDLIETNKHVLRYCSDTKSVITRYYIKFWLCINSQPHRLDRFETVDHYH